MTLPVAPSSISFSQLACELGNTCTNISLRDYSQCAALSSPDAISELYGKKCTPIYGVGAWSIGGALTAARRQLAGAGTQNQAIAFGGYTNTFLRCTEEYNGSNWTTSGVGTLAVSRWGLGGVGNQNSALASGGHTSNIPLSCTELYNGSNWAGGNALGVARHVFGSVGTQNAALSFGGVPNCTCTEKYNGSVWTASGVASMSNGRHSFGSAGIQNAALAFNGIIDGSTFVNCTESYNGSNWSTSASSPVMSDAAGTGLQNSALMSFMGQSLGSTYEFNGSNWSSGGSVIIARAQLTIEGSQESALGFGGSTNTDVACTEEYNKPFCYNSLS